MLLIIHQSDRLTRPLVEMFRYAGILAQRAKPAEALSEISALYRAVLILRPEDLPNAEDYVGRLRSYGGHVPVFALSDTPNDQASPLFAHIFPIGSSASDVIGRIHRFAEEHALPPLGCYRMCGFDASSQTAGTTYLGRSFPLTGTERRILQFLLRAYPSRMTAKQILTHVYPPDRMPDLCTVRTHICAINRKFRTRPHLPHPSAPKDILIDLVPGEGYTLSTRPLKEDEPYLSFWIEDAAK